MTWAVPPTRTTCPYCGVGCGVLAGPDDQGGTLIAGDPDHPANRGRLCSKGSALGETLGYDGRLLHPMLLAADGALTRVTWDAALDRVASGFRQTLERHGPDADLSPYDYAELAPVQWPLRRQRCTGQARLFANGRFFTPDGRARLIAIARPKLPRKTGKQRSTGA